MGCCEGGGCVLLCLRECCGVEGTFWSFPGCGLLSSWFAGDIGCRGGGRLGCRIVGPRS